MHKKTLKLSLLFIFVLMLTACASICMRSVPECRAMPFYDLSPKDIVLRAAFYTSYTTSSDERKNNIAVAAKSLDNAFIDVNGEFSFNQTVGERTEKRGYKPAKIISGGKFVTGIGGGVCQVSTTLYNAALLAGLKITEFHPHSLAVSYVAPSFDAMVNSGSADLRFINNTKNPIIIKTHADASTIKIEIYGEPMKEKYVRQSVIKGEIPSTEKEIIPDALGEYPDLYEGEIKVLKYGKNGIISTGILIKQINGKPVSTSVIRCDRYNPTKTIIIEGTAKRDAAPPDDKEITDTITYFGLL